MSDFSGKIALVTGTTGIARAAALHLAAHGALILGLGIDEKGNAELAKGESITVRKTDVSRPDDVESAFGELESRFGGLDVIVNSAAIHPYGDAVTTDPRAISADLCVFAWARSRKPCVSDSACRRGSGCRGGRQHAARKARTAQDGRRPATS